MKKLVTVIIAIALICASIVPMASCGDKKADFNIGILQVATHSALDDARNGFKDTVDAWAKSQGKTVKYTEQNANGDATNEISQAESLVNADPNLVLGISTSSSRALANSTRTIPVLFTAVTDPEGESLIRDNVTGTSDLNPVADQIALIKELVPSVSKIAFLYNSSETNSVLQFNLAKAKCQELGIECVSKTATTTSDIQTVVEGITEDAVYVPTDNLMAANMNLICGVLNPKHIPTVAGESGQCKDGEAVATLGIDYYKLGVQTAQMAIKILSGEKQAKDIPFESYNQPLTFTINEVNAKACGFTDAQISQIKANH